MLIKQKMRIVFIFMFGQYNPNIQVYSFSFLNSWTKHLQIIDNMSSLEIRQYETSENCCIKETTKETCMFNNIILKS